MSLEYYAQEAATIDELNKEIKSLIKDGWRPIGGVSISLSESDESQYFVCAQAMIREDK